MSLALHIPVCHLCPDRQQGCAGPCACTIDGRDIIDHAKSGDCPLNKYPRLSTSRSPSFALDYDPEAKMDEIRRLRAGGCCHGGDAK